MDSQMMGNVMMIARPRYGRQARPACAGDAASGSGR